jgi:general secretion pathway protein B
VSLILDALRRADSERERGAVPGLHAQPVPAASPVPAPREGQVPWMWVIAAAVVGLVAGLAWFIAVRQTPPAATTAPAAIAPAPVIAAAPAPPLPPQAESAEPKPVAEPAPWPAQDGSRKASVAGAPAAAATAPAAPRTEARAMPAAGAVSAEAPITLREQLPENVRSQLPPLAVGGSIYSSSAADRSLIVDGRILRENDRLNADLTLEQIRPKSAVFRFRGHRFEVGF